MRSTITILSLLILVTTSAAAESVVAKVTAAVQGHAGLSAAEKAYVTTTLVPLITASELATACAQQNAAGMTLDDIKKIDGEWKAAEDPIDIMLEKLTNACAEYLTAFAEQHPEVLEAFAMDHHGANVGQSAVTSDFWQGDEAKWKNSYADGAGGIDVGDIEHDESTNQVLRQVSLPIVGTDGAVVGAITFGIDVTSLK